MIITRRPLLIAVLPLLALAAMVLGYEPGDPPPEGFEPPDPLSPERAMGSFEVAEGLRIERVAAEPLVTDPVAFD